MNLSTVQSLSELRGSTLPRPAPGPRLRLLVLTMKYTGLSSFGHEMVRFVEHRDDVEAVHVFYKPPTALRILNKVAHRVGVRDEGQVRFVSLWSHQLRRWMRPGGRLDLNRFDAAIFTSQFTAIAAASLRSTHQCRICVYGDSSTPNNIRDFDCKDEGHARLARLEQMMLDGTDLVACTSRWAADSFHSDCGIPRHRIVLVPPTAHPLPYQPREHAGALPRIIFIGNSFERKGGSRLVRWHQQYWKDQAELHIVSAEAEPDPSCRNIVWHRRVPRATLMNDLLPTMDLFAMPTRRDQSCWPAVEAAAAGVPSAVSAIGGIPDLIEDGVTGRLIAPNDDEGWIRTIGDLLKDRARLGEMGRRANERASRLYTPEAVFSPLLEKVRSIPRREDDSRH